MNDALIAGALLAGACAIAMCALVFARLAHIPRLLRHVLGIFAMTPPDAADTLVMLAGLARRKGLLVVEQHHALARLPVFHEGVRLMLAGHRPAAIREALAATAAPPTRALTFQHLLQPLGLTAAAVALALLVAGGADPSTLPFAPPILALALLAAATALPLSAHGPFAARHDPRLTIAMQIEAAAMIAAGCRPSDLRSALLALPMAGEHHPILARAA